VGREFVKDIDLLRSYPMYKLTTPNRTAALDAIRCEAEDRVRSRWEAYVYLLGQVRLFGCQDCLSPLMQESITSVFGRSRYERIQGGYVRIQGARCERIASDRPSRQLTYCARSHVYSCLRVSLDFASFSVDRKIFH
jgi:hypothetical protein